MIEDAIILCAGFGTRLRPLTNFVPKPLFPIVCKPALALVIESLARRGIKNFFCNAHHLADKIVAASENIPQRVRVFVEPKILGTAGGIGNIFFRLGKPNRTFLVHNGDVVENFDLDSALRFHRENQFAATLILVDNPAVNTVVVEGNRVVGFGTDGTHRLTYSGVGFFEPGVLSAMPHYRFASLTEVLMPFVRAGQVGAFVETGFWSDFGTPESYLALHRDILVGGALEIPGAGEKIFFAGEKIPPAKFSGFCAVCPEAEISPEAHLENCVVWENSRVLPGRYSNSIITPYGIVQGRDLG